MSEQPLPGGPDPPTTLKFAPKMKYRIFDGIKDATIRLPDEYDAPVGETVVIAEPDGTPFGTAYIESVTTAAARDAPVIARKLNALHGAETVGDLVSALNGYYDETVTPATLVDIVVFRLLTVEQ